MENQFQYFPNNRNIFIERTIQRPTNIIRKQIIYKSQRILELARGYFGNNINIEGLELGNTTDSEELGNSHWEGRFLLGDIMTTNLYFQDQVISDFTLALLEDTGWYKINKYTGGLMRFGKNKGKSFFEDDCLQKVSDKITPRFSNEFCSQPYGTCSSGRLSKGICNTTINYAISEEYKRNGISDSLN
jgi:hypothetical protein